MLDATATLDGVVFDDTRGAAIAAARGSITATGNEIRGTDPTVDGTGGYGVELDQGSVFDLSDSTLSGLDGIGILVSGASTATVSRVTIDRVQPTPVLRAGPGVAAELGASVSIEDSTSRGCSPALLVLEDGVIEGDRLSLEDNGFAGVVVGGGTVTLRDSSVFGTVSDPATGGGLGVYVAEDRGWGTLRLERVEIGAQPIAAVWAAGANTIEIVDSDLTGGTGYPLGDATVQGNAVFARDLGTGAVSVTDSRLGGSRVAVLLHDATATLEGTDWDGNDADLVVQACGDQPLPDPDGATSVVLCPERDAVYLPLSWDFVLPEISVGE